MGRAFGPYIPPVNELFADHRLPRQGKRRRHTNEHLSFVSLSLHNAERHRAPLPLAALFKSNSGRFEHRCVALSATSSKAAPPWTENLVLGEVHLPEKGLEARIGAVGVEERFVG